MTLLFIFAYGLLSIVALYFMAAPFLGSPEEQLRAELLDEELKRVERLIEEKAMHLKSLRELEFELETAKISDADYKRLRDKFERRAIGVMRKLDEIYGGRGWEEGIDLEIEERVLALSKPQKGKKVKKRKAKAAAQSECFDCGSLMSPSDKFCAQCGATVGAEAASA